MTWKKFHENQMLGSAKTNLLLLTLTSWVKVASPLSQSYLKLSKLLYKVIYNLSQNFVKVVPKLTQICLKLQCFFMIIQISSYAFVFLCPSRTWRSSSAVSSPGGPKTWPTSPVLRSPINLSWFACVFKTHYFRSNRFYLFFSQWSFFGRNCVLHSTLLLISFVFFFCIFMVLTFLWFDHVHFDKIEM